jgi:ribosomal protein L37E
MTHSETQRRANALRAEAARVRPLDAELADRLAAGADRLALRAAVRADDRARRSPSASEAESDFVANGPASEGAPAPEGGVSSFASEADAEPPSIVCPRCGRRSYNLRDIEERYCGACHHFHDDPEADAVAHGPASEAASEAAS